VIVAGLENGTVVLATDAVGDSVKMGTGTGGNVVVVDALALLFGAGGLVAVTGGGWESRQDDGVVRDSDAAGLTRRLDFDWSSRLPACAANILDFCSSTFLGQMGYEWGNPACVNSNIGKLVGARHQKSIV
jgi:hypothetical protein